MITLTSSLRKIAEEIILSVRLRVKPPKRRTPLDRLKARLYYRRNKSKILTMRRRYLRKNKTILKNRKLFHRYKPTWLKKPPKPKKPKIFRHN